MAVCHYSDTPDKSHTTCQEGQQGLNNKLRDQPGQPLTRVVVDALDEAGSDQERRRITEALKELARLPWLRVAVGTRPLATGDPLVQGGMLRALGVTSNADRSLVDLDSDTYFDFADLRQSADTLLAQHRVDYPGPREAAWKQYRARDEIRGLLADNIAHRAGRNFLVAAMTADQLSTEPEMIDPTANGFDPASIPSKVGEVLSKYLDGLPDEERQERVRVLLTVLAYARGAGLDDLTWLAFAKALQYPAKRQDLDFLRSSGGSDYLLQTTAAEHDAPRVTRLFHQALADELLVIRDQRSDEGMLLDMLLNQAESTDWQARYTREHIVEHAVAADRLDRLLEEPHALLSVAPARLVRHLDRARSDTARAIATVYRCSADALASLDESAQATQLEKTAHRLGCCSVATWIARMVPSHPWQTESSQACRASSHQVLTGHIGRVRAVAVAELPNGTPVVVSGGGDYNVEGTIRVWRLEDGALAWKPLRCHGWVMALAIGRLADGIPVIISGGDGDGTVRVRRLEDGAPIGKPLRGHAENVRALTIGSLNNTPVIVSSDDDTVRVWRLEDGAPLGEPIHTRCVWSLATGTLADGTMAIITGSAGEQYLWRLPADSPAKATLSSDSRMWPVAIAKLPNGTPVIIAGIGVTKVGVWQLEDGALVRELPRRIDTGICPTALATAELAGDIPVIVAAGGTGMLQVWRLTDGAPVGEPLPTSGGDVLTLAARTLADGTSVIVSGGDDGIVRVWRLQDGAFVAGPLCDHARPESPMHALGTVALLAIGSGAPPQKSHKPAHPGEWSLGRENGNGAGRGGRGSLPPRGCRSCCRAGAGVGQ